MIKDKLESLRTQLDTEKKDLVHIERKVKELVTLRTKIFVEQTDNSNLEVHLESARRKEKATEEINKQINILEKFRQETETRINNLQQRLNDEHPELIDKQIKQAQEKIHSHLQKYVEHLVSAHECLDEIVQLKENFGCNIPHTIKNPKVYQYWLQVQRKRSRNTFQDLLNSSIIGHLTVEE